MKKSSIFILLILIPVIMAMGSGLDGDSPEKIPVPKEKFNATYIDQMDIVTDCTDISINGKTFIEGNMGEGVYTMPFKEIKDVTFLQKDGKLAGVVKLVGNGQVDLILNTNHKAYGKTKYGTFQIKIAKLKKMTLHH
ncbi:MAG: hypothetical protein JXB42_00640 [Deltaproteobacteria bacterium]|nr:hypothetical protein [Deltaproteobacteria bacterium]